MVSMSRNAWSKRADERTLLELEAAVRDLVKEQAGLREDLQRLIDAMIVSTAAKE